MQTENDFHSNSRALINNKNSSFENNQKHLSDDKFDDHTYGNGTKKVSGFDRKFATACNYYRFISLFLTSLLFLMFSTNISLLQRVILVLVLVCASVIVVHLYKRFHQNTRTFNLVLLAEVFGVVMLLYYSGGFESPFIWYALNPLILVSIHLPFYITWILLSFFFLGSSFEYIFVQNRVSSFSEVLMTQLGIIFTLVMLTVIIQVFSRLYHTMREQSERLQLQQQELFTTYQTVFENQQLFQALSNYQQEIVTYKRDVDIYSSLASSLEATFPFDSVGIFVLDEPGLFKHLTPNYPVRIITSNFPEGESKKKLSPLVIKEVKDRWQELFSSSIIKGKNREWIAMPLWNEKKKLMAVFVGILRPGTEIYRPSETLHLFITFTEQVIQRLYSLNQAEKSLEHLSSLYSAAEAISSRSDPREIIDLYAAYAKALSGCEKVVFWLEQLDFSKSSPENDQGSFYTVRGKKGNFPDECWYPKLIDAWSKMREDLQPVVKLIEDPASKSMAQLVCVPVKSRSQCLGMLAALQPNVPAHTDEIIQTLTFLAELSSITIERNIAELFADRLIVLEEQNRIANEIHDNISQNLFSIVYSLEAILRHPETDSFPHNFGTQLSTIRDVAAVTSREIRLLIYRLSPRHRNDKTFIKELENFVEGLGTLNQIVVEFNVEGKEDYLSPAVQNAFYRIAKEASNNAVRHGQCSKVTIDLNIEPLSSVLKITDDGKGFEVDGINNNGKSNGKLGLVNMRELTISLQGKFDIESEPVSGTTVTCTLPNIPVVAGA